MSQKPITQKNWNLLDDGVLWKEVIKGAADQEFREQAKVFVTQLQEGAKPKNALEGLLLDRMASGHLRKAMLLWAEAGLRNLLRARARKESAGRTAEETASAVAIGSLPTLDLRVDPMLKHESMLDRGFHRDTSLLQQLQKGAGESAPLAPKKPAKSNGKSIEGDSGTPMIG